MGVWEKKYRKARAPLEKLVEAFCDDFHLLLRAPRRPNQKTRMVQTWLPQIDNHSEIAINMSEYN